MSLDENQFNAFKVEVHNCIRVDVVTWVTGQSWRQCVELQF